MAKSEKEIKRRQEVKPKTRKGVLRSQFPPGVLLPFFPLLAETVAEVTRGGSGTEERFQVSVEIEETMSLEKAVALCRRHGFGAKIISHALVQPIVMRTTAFPEGLDKITIEGIKSSLTPKIASLLKPPRGRR